MNKLNTRNVEKKNISFFSKNSVYQKDIINIDTYKNIYVEISKRLEGTNKLLDVGHGGVFDYNTKKIKKIIGLDLNYMNYNNLPSNIKLIKGSILDKPKKTELYDKVLMNMLLHHLTGKDINENFINLNKSIDHSKKVLNKKGKLIIVESCVPYWFNFLEKIVYKPASKIILKYFNHPPVFQFTIAQIINVLKKKGFKKVNYKIIKQGNFILQFGYKFPTILTPVKTVLFTARYN